MSDLTKAERQQARHDAIRAKFGAISFDSVEDEREKIVEDLEAVDENLQDSLETSDEDSSGEGEKIGQE